MLCFNFFWLATEFLFRSSSMSVYHVHGDYVWQIADDFRKLYYFLSLTVCMPHINNATQDVPIVRFRAVRELFVKLTSSLGAFPSSLGDSRIDENLAIAFLVAKERLVWADLACSRLPSYLGHQITKCQTDGYFVAAILVKTPYELGCILSLPCIVR